MQTLKHSDEGHTETRTQKTQNTGRDSGTRGNGDIQTLKQTNRIYNTGMHKEWDTETHRLTGGQGQADTGPQYTMEITDTRAQRHWNAETSGN